MRNVYCLLSFILLQLFSGCNQEMSRSELATTFTHFTSKYGSQLKAVTRWMGGLNKDSSFAMEYWNKDGSAHFYYLDISDGNYKRGSYFDESVEMPKQYLDLFNDIHLDRIVKEKNKSYYAVSAGNFYKQAYLLILQKNVTEFVGYNNIDSLQTNFKNQYADEWAFPINRDMMFVSLN